MKSLELEAKWLQGIIQATIELIIEKCIDKTEAAEFFRKAAQMFVVAAEQVERMDGKN